MNPRPNSARKGPRRCLSSIRSRDSKRKQGRTFDWNRQMLPESASFDLAKSQIRLNGLSPPDYAGQKSGSDNRHGQVPHIFTERDSFGNPLDRLPFRSVSRAIAFRSNQAQPAFLEFTALLNERLPIGLKSRSGEGIDTMSESFRLRVSESRDRLSTTWNAAVSRRCYGHLRSRSSGERYTRRLERIRWPNRHLPGFARMSFMRRPETFQS